MKKGRQEKIITEPKAEKIPICHVCWTKDPQNKAKTNRPKDVDLERKKVLETYSCTQCKIQVHKYCYDPSLSSNQSWKCDHCKHPKTKSIKQECFICKCEGKMLKMVDDNKFVHIHCALASDSIILENFKTLKFRLNPDFKPKQTKEVNSKNKEKQSSVPKCTICKKDTTQAVFKCHHIQCTFTSHIPCLLKHKFEIGSDDDILYNLMSQTIGSFRIKNHEFLKKSIQNLRGMQLLEKPKRSLAYITCGSHSSEIKWCTTCFRTVGNDNMSECSRCYGWSHPTCATMKNKSQESYFQCDPCFHNRPYLQRALLPDQINKLVQIQTSSTEWTRDQIKYLDSFAFKSSVQICQQIFTRNKDDFQFYHLYNFLEKEYLMSFETKNLQKQKKIEPVQKILDRISEKINPYIKEFNAKKIIEILYFIKHKQYRSKNELNTVKDINDLRDVYPKKQAKNSDKKTAKKVAEEQKCRKILIFLLDHYTKNLKQAELKDVSMKLVEFSDNIRKEIAHIKDSNLIASDSKKHKKQQNVKNLIDLLKKRPYRIAQEVREMLKMISQNKEKFKGKLDIEPLSSIQNNLSEANCKSQKQPKNKQALQNNFLMTLIRCMLSREQGYENQMFDTQDLMDLLDSYRKIIYISRVASKTPQKKLALSDEEYYKIMNKSYDPNKTVLSEESKVRISKYFKSLIKEHNIKEAYQIKSEMTEKYDRLIQEDRLNYKQTLMMKENLAEFGVYTDKHSKLLNMEKRAIYYRVLKIKYMKIVNLELKAEASEPNFPLKPSEKNRKDIIENIKRLLDANGKSIKLTDEEKKKLEYFLVKQEVFTNILKEEILLGQKLDPYTAQILAENNKIEEECDENQKRNDTSNRTKPQLTIFQRIKRIFKYWMENRLQNSYQIVKILSPIAQKHISFPFEYTQAFNDLIDSLGQRMNLLLCSEDPQYNGSYNSPHKVNSDQFMRLWKLIEYADLDQSFQKLKMVHEEYKEWLSDLETRFNPISKILEDKYLNKELLDVIDRKIQEAERLEIDLRTEIKKLRIVKLWAVLSQKFQKDFERKPTINAMQQFKAHMLKVNYPQNAIFKQVIELQIYGRTINERIDKFLKKQKFEDLEYYEEIRLVYSKMSLRQAQQLKVQLENSKLDVSAELQTLEQEIISFYQIPSKIEPELKKEDNLEELIKIKAKIIESPIRYESMDGFCQLYHRISFLKCQNMDGKINRKEFFRLLNTSELGSLILTEKYPHLLKAYRDIEKSQKQMASLRPKFENLLPVDGSKLKQDLSSDPLSLAYIQKVYQKVESVREKYRGFKTTKQPYERYMIIESQLSHLPVYYKDIQVEIHNMKRDLDNMVDKAMMLKKNFNPKQANEVMRKYRQCGMKHSELELIKKVNDTYNICMALSEKQEDYVEFTQKCKEYPEMDSIISLNELRNQLFGIYVEEVLEQKAEAGQENKFSINFIRALIDEGLFLLKHVINSIRNNASVRQKTLTILLKLNQKIDFMTKNSQAKTKHNQGNWQDEYGSGDFEDGSGQDEGQYDDSESDQMDDDQEEDSMEYDDGYEEESDNMPLPPPTKKRGQPLVMEISDEDDEPVAQPRKVSHINPAQPFDRQANEIIQQSQEAQNISSSQK